MILTDEVIDRVHRLQIESLRLSGEAAKAIDPAATGVEMGTGYALFAGVGCPVTQAVGMAHRSPGDIEEIEAFFAPLTPDWEVAVNPFTDVSTVRALLDKGYRPAQFEGHLGQWIEAVPEVPSVEVIEADEANLAVWTEVTGRGWSGDETEEFVADAMARFAAEMKTRHYLAFADGVPAASASMLEFGDSVVFMGGTTRVPFRGRGLQTALLARRLRDAGIGRFASMGAMPGTQSHRNAQRAGFMPLYSSLTLVRRPA